jgi:hypothetical protein
MNVESSQQQLDLGKFTSLNKFVDHLLMLCWIDGKKNLFQELLNLVQTNKIDGKPTLIKIRNH